MSKISTKILKITTILFCLLHTANTFQLSGNAQKKTPVVRASVTQKKGNAPAVRANVVAKKVNAPTGAANAESNPPARPAIPEAKGQLQEVNKRKYDNLQDGASIALQTMLSLLIQVGKLLGLNKIPAANTEDIDSKKIAIQIVQNQPINMVFSFSPIDGLEVAEENSEKGQEILRSPHIKIQLNNVEILSTFGADDFKHSIERFIEMQKQSATDNVIDNVRDPISLVRELTAYLEDSLDRPRSFTHREMTVNGEMTPELKDFYEKRMPLIATFFMVELFQNEIIQQMQEKLIEHLMLTQNIDESTIAEINEKYSQLSDLRRREKITRLINAYFKNNKSLNTIMVNIACSRAIISIKCATEQDAKDIEQSIQQVSRIDNIQKHNAHLSQVSEVAAQDFAESFYEVQSGKVNGIKKLCSSYGQYPRPKELVEAQKQMKSLTNRMVVINLEGPKMSDEALTTVNRVRASRGSIVKTFIANKDMTTVQPGETYYVYVMTNTYPVASRNRLPIFNNMLENTIGYSLYTNKKSSPFYLNITERRKIREMIMREILSTILKDMTPSFTIEKIGNWHNSVSIIDAATNKNILQITTNEIGAIYAADKNIQTLFADLSNRAQQANSTGQSE